MSKSSFTVAGLTAAPTSRQSAVLDLTFADTPTKLPLFVLNGAHVGPTVVVTAGIHGAEYVGIEAAMRLAKQADLSALHGQLVIAPIASMTAFAKRAIYVAPPDSKNLNRCFPGDPAGSFAEQLAHWILKQVMRYADFYLDLHGGDLNEALVPFSIVKHSGNAKVDARAIALAEAFGLPDIVMSNATGSTISAVADLGIPAVLAEIGGQGQWPQHEVQAMFDGLQRALAHTGLIKTSHAKQPTRVLQEMAWLRSAHDGLFYPQCNVGDVVKAGQVLGYITNYLGETVQTALAPVDGVVLFLVTTLAMNNGDPLLSVGA